MQIDVVDERILLTASRYEGFTGNVVVLAFPPRNFLFLLKLLQELFPSLGLKRNRTRWTSLKISHIFIVDYVSLASHSLSGRLDRYG
jgi:hypothetical protein